MNLKICRKESVFKVKKIPMWTHESTSLYVYFVEYSCLSSVESQVLESEDFTQYQGKWIAILDKKVIASGKTMSEVYDQVQLAKVIRTALFQKIPEKGVVDTFIL